MSIKRNRKVTLSLSDIKKFKNMLIAKRNEIVGDVFEMENEVLRRERSELSNMPFHMADAGTDNYEIEHTIGLMDSERKLLEQIYQALQRIEDGKYGICEGTGKPIPKERLEAIPWAKYCVEYANMLEKGSIKNNFYPRNIKYDYDQVDYDQDNDQNESSHKKAL